MHYRDGRLAKPGDKVVNLITCQAGLIYDLQPGMETCNARLAQILPTDGYISIRDCVHQDSLQAAFSPPPANP